MRNENQTLKYRFRSLEQTIKHELITKNDVNQFIQNNNKKQIALLRNEIIVISNNVQNDFVDIIIEFKKINFVNFASFLINVNIKKNQKTFSSKHNDIQHDKREKQFHFRDFLNMNIENENIDQLSN